MGRKISGKKSVQVPVPASTVINAGDFVLLDGHLGMAVQGIETDANGMVIKFKGETVPAGLIPAEIILDTEEGVYEISANQINTAETFAKGSKVYWDNANKRFTTTAVNNLYAGVVERAKDDNNVIWLSFEPQRSTLTQAEAQANSTATDIAAVVADFNALLAKLKAAGLMAS